MKNPLLPDLRIILQTASLDGVLVDGTLVEDIPGNSTPVDGKAVAMSEYEVMQALRDSPAFAVIGWEGDLALFQRHFFLMNALYQLQQEVEQSGKGRLEISALAIRLVVDDNAATTDVSKVYDATTLIMDDSDNNNLRDYYLDWANYRDTNADDVANLLSQFWKKYWRINGKEEAFEVLGLTAGVSEMEIKKRYQSLASEHHPDKGGDAEAFIKIRHAYETLIVN